MTNVDELRKRKGPINLAIVHVDADSFIASFMGWLEIPAFLASQKLGTVPPAADGPMPMLAADELESASVKSVGNDAVFAFCMTAAMKCDMKAVLTVQSGLRERFGEGFPGSAAAALFLSKIDTPAMLEEIVAAGAHRWLVGDRPPPPMRAKEDWTMGLRSFEKARSSNFVSEIMYPLARWTRERWTIIAEKEAAFLHHIEDNLPIVRAALEDPRNDQAFVANLLLKTAPAVDMELTEEYEGFLRSLGRR